VSSQNRISWVVGQFILSESNKFANHCDWLGPRTWAPGLPPSSAQCLRAPCRSLIGEIRSGPMTCQLQVGVGGSSKVTGPRPAPWVTVQAWVMYYCTRTRPFICLTPGSILLFSNPFVDTEGDALRTGTDPLAYPYALLRHLLSPPNRRFRLTKRAALASHEAR